MQGGLLSPRCTRQPLGGATPSTPKSRALPFKLRTNGGIRKVGASPAPHVHPVFVFLGCVDGAHLLILASTACPEKSSVCGAAAHCGHKTCGELRATH